MLEITGLSRHFGSSIVLDRVSLHQQRGDVTCIVGPSGCGKSTLLRLVAGLDTPDAGEIRIDGEALSSPHRIVPVNRRRINMVFQDYALWPHMRVNRIVGYGLQHMNRADRERRVSELLRLMRIEGLADRLPSELSGGQQQRVAIARALATEPRILLLDEPLSNLDVQLRTEMRLEFASLFRNVGTTVLYVTHDPLEACSFADNLVVMRKGQIEQQGRPETLFSAPSSQWVAMLAGYDIHLGADALRHDGASCIADVGGQPVRFALANGDAGPQNSAIRPDADVKLMLHPASIRFGETHQAEANCLSGTVHDILYEGRQWRVSLQVGEERLSLLVPFRCEPGERVTFSFSPQDVVAFA